jgi:CBS domain containing-hemolysin-like protein
MGLLLLWISLAVIVSHFCSLLETTLFFVRQSALLDRRAQGNAGAARLLAIKRDRIDDAIAAILILNTLAIAVGSTLAGAQAARLFGEARVGWLSAALTVLLLVVSEIIPKSMAARYAARLSGFVGYALSALMTVMAPALVVTRALVHLLARHPRERFTRREFTLLVDAAPREGAISLAESALIENLIYSREVAVREVMTPAPHILMMEAERTVADLLADPGVDAFSRIPLYRNDRRHVVGYLLHREVLKAYAENNDSRRPLADFLRPIPILRETVPVPKAMEQILQQHEAIALVADQRGEAIGLVTLEDLIEAILGMEITDEAEAVGALRPAVTQSRKRRAERLRRKRREQVPPANDESD